MDNIKLLIPVEQNDKTSLSELLPVSLYLAKEGIICIFLFDKYPNKAQLAELKNNSLQYYTESKVDAEKKRSQSQKKELRLPKEKKITTQTQNLQTSTLTNYKSQLRQFINTLVRTHKTKKFVSGVIKKEKPVATLVTRDSKIFGGIPETIYFSRKYGIPVINLNVASDDKNFLFNSHRKHNPDVNTTNNLNRLIANLLPSQARSFDNQTTLFFSGGTTLALLINGMLPKNPWHSGESWSKNNLMISKRHLQYAKENGAECKRATIVGQLSLDDLHTSYINKIKIKESLVNKYFNKTQHQRPIIIFCLPQFFEHNLLCQEKSLEEIYYILDYLETKNGYSTFVSLHPKMNFDDYKHINTQYKNIRVVEERLKEILPISSYYIACFESTLPWAILCDSIPIFLDFYHLGFDPSAFQSCMVLKNKESMANDINKIIENSNNVRKLFAKDTQLLPPFDGKAGQRIKQAINKTIKES